MTQALSLAELEELQRLALDVGQHVHDKMNHMVASQVSGQTIVELVMNPAHVLALIAQARLCARLVSALAWLAERGWWSMARKTPDEIMAYAEHLGWKDPQ